jgi:hypothetical protein
MSTNQSKTLPRDTAKSEFSKISLDERFPVDHVGTLDFSEILLLRDLSGSSLVGQVIIHAEFFD